MILLNFKLCERSFCSKKFALIQANYLVTKFQFKKRKMSEFKNTFYSSSADVNTGATFENFATADTNLYKKRIPKPSTNSKNNNNNNNISLNRTNRTSSRISRVQQEHSAYLFWTLVVVLFILALGNLILTIVILNVLRLGQGMESLELVPNEYLIKFFGNIDLDNIYKRDGKLESFNDSPMEIVGDDGSVTIGILETEREITPVINLGSKLEVIKNVESFDVKHPVSGKSLFSTDYPNFGLPSGVDKLDVRLVLTKRISSAVDQSLLIKSDSFIKLKGSEGIQIDGKEVKWSADQDIVLKSVNKSIILNGLDGIYMDLRNMQVVSLENNMRTYFQYKICVCMPDGKLFRLFVPPGQGSTISCSNIDQSDFENPCL